MFNKIITPVLLSFALMVSAQAERPIKIVVPFTPGGIVDTTNRVLHASLERELGQQVNIETRPGAGGAIGLRYIAQNKTDEVLITVIDAIALANVMALDDRVDIEDFKYLSQLGGSSNIALVVKKGSPLKDINYWRTYRGNPISIGANGFGGAHHFYSWNLNNYIAFPRTDIFFKGINEAMPMVIGGHMDAMWSQFANVEGFERDGKVDIVAVNSVKRNPTAPHIPTFRELGIDSPGAKWILISNQTTDLNTIRNIESAVNRLINTREFVKSLEIAGVVTDLSLTLQSKSSTIQALQQQKKFVEYVKTLK
jgi:tripartite-type tricarboxylate transporter receptor subunit TctC